MVERAILIGMDEFVSEPIEPAGDGFDTAAMSRGEPGIARAFRWRGRAYHVVARISQWKSSSREGGRATADLYLRRHYYELQMDDGSRWTVYFERQPRRSASPRARWFLYTRRPPESDPPS